MSTGEQILNATGYLINANEINYHYLNLQIFYLPIQLTLHAKSDSVTIVKFRGIFLHIILFKSKLEIKKTKFSFFYA